MQLGALYPQEDPEFATGTEVPRGFAEGVEAAGYDYLTIPDHVIGPDSKSRPGASTVYDADTPIREVFTHMGFLAAITNLELSTAVLVLPQRQTQLVAKQAAELDWLTKGRFRLGIGIGWSAPEFESMGADFSTRGARFSEQVEVLRLLWTEPIVTFSGRFHEIDRAGILPLPIQKPIPLWFGGGMTNERVIDRIGRLSDGWISGPSVDINLVGSAFARIRESAERSGRDPSQLGLQSTLRLGREIDPSEISRRIELYPKAGVTHITVETRRNGFSLQQHLDVLATVGELVRQVA